MPKSRRNFTDAESLQACVDGYFAMCDVHTTKTLIGRGKDAKLAEVPAPLPYTFTRLAVVCGVAPHTLTEIQRRGEEEPDGPDGELADVIAFARLRIEANLEERMLRGAGWGPGHVLALKHHYGWRDANEYTGADGGPIILHFDKQDEKL
jgi:hypothetical protein